MYRLSGPLPPHAAGVRLLGADSLRSVGAGVALDARWISVKALMSLVADGLLPPAVVQQALQRYQLSGSA
jgi:hypothetical protein